MDWSKLKEKLKKANRYIAEWASAPGPSSADELINVSRPTQKKKKEEDFFNI